MGLFHKTIEDMEKEFSSGNADKARKILQKHIEAEHQFMSDLSHLMRASAAFQQQLANMNGGWSAWTKDKLTFQNGIRELRNQLTGIEYTMGKLVKETKMELK